MDNQSLKVFRKKAGLSQKDVANALNITQGAISSWEMGRTNPDVEMIKKLSELFHVSIDELISDESQQPLWNNINVELEPQAAEHGILVPVVATLRCGWGHKGDGFTIIRNVELPQSYFRKWGNELRITIAKGNSMLPTIKPGDELICVPGENWRDGNIVVVDVNDSDTVKRIYRSKDGGIDLVPDNQQYKAVHYTIDDLQDLQIHVLGRVAKVMSPDLI